MNSYLCTRWGQSLVAGSGVEWRFVVIGYLPPESLEAVRKEYLNKNVVIIRFADESLSSGQEDAWWTKFVGTNWRVIKASN